MKNLLTNLVFIITVLFCAHCSRSPSAGTKADLTQKLQQSTRFAKTDILIYNDILMENKCCLIKKGEEVTVYNILAHPYKLENLEPLQMTQIVLKNGQQAFREEHFFAIDMIVITDEQVPLYTRCDSSSRYSSAMAGSIAMVTDKKGEWLQLEALSDTGRLLSGRWVNRGYTREAELIQSALLLDRIREKIADGIEAENDDIAALATLAQDESAVGALAQRLLSEIRVREEEFGETGDGESASENKN